eukprot:4015014-Karenia_brevis.AAC.1
MCLVVYRTCGLAAEVPGPFFHGCKVVGLRAMANANITWRKPVVGRLSQCLHLAGMGGGCQCGGGATAFLEGWVTM